jgi:phosphoribosylformylglycinamidine synthase
MAVVDNLNFGNPEKPEVMWQFRECVEGISSACEALGIPVVGGNVSFYNETDGEDIHPTPVVGLLGLADPVPIRPPRLDRAEPGMEIWELGPSPTDNLAGSSLQRILGAGLTGRPTAPNAAAALESIDAACRLAHQAPVLHDISDGGIAVALAEICIASDVGAVITTDCNVFSEDPHRFLAVAPPGTLTLTADTARRIGTMGGDTIEIGGSALSVADAASIWRNALPNGLAG